MNNKYNSLMKSLDKELSNLNTKEKYLEYLRNSSYHYKYNYANQLAITMKNPGAKAVASYNFWKEIAKRPVRKNENGIPILNKQRNGVEYVFDISQTVKLDNYSENINPWEFNEIELRQTLGENDLAYKVDKIISKDFDYYNDLSLLIHSSIIYQTAYRLGIKDLTSYEKSDFNKISSISKEDLQKVLYLTNKYSKIAITKIKDEHERRLENVRHIRYGRNRGHGRDANVLLGRGNGQVLSSKGGQDLPGSSTRESRPSKQVGNNEKRNDEQFRESTNTETIQGTSGRWRDGDLSERSRRESESNTEFSRRRVQEERNNRERDESSRIYKEEESNRIDADRNSNSSRDKFINNKKTEVIEQQSMASFFVAKNTNNINKEPEKLLLDKDLDNDGVIDRYDADPTDSTVQTIADKEERDNKYLDKSDYWIVEFNETSKFIEKDYSGQIVTKELLDEIKEIDENTKIYNDAVGKDAYGEINDLWQGYSKFYFSHIVNGEIVDNRRIDLGDGNEVNKFEFDLLYNHISKEGIKNIKVNDIVKIDNEYRVINNIKDSKNENGDFIKLYGFNSFWDIDLTKFKYSNTESIKENQKVEIIGNISDFEAIKGSPINGYRKINNNRENLTPSERIKNNIEAIKILNKLDEEQRLPAENELNTLSNYTGWGGLSEIFDKNKDKWNSEKKELKEILTKDQYEKAGESVLNAYYTPNYVIENIYKILENMGFSNGKILEPSAGIGNFISQMPKKIKLNSEIHAVELDEISAKLAKALNNETNVINTGFENTNFNNNAFDLVIGNIPFGNYQLFDPEYAGSNMMIHDYFIEKSIDKAKDKSLIALITSKGTMDKKNSSIRERVAKKADLLGAIRLPDNIFKGTEVTTDILFFKKNQDKVFELEKESWIKVGEKDGISMNEYFIKNPDNVLGEMTIQTGRFGEETSCKEKGNTKELFEKAINNFPKDIYRKQIDLNGIFNEDLDKGSYAYSIKEGKIKFNGEDIELSNKVEEEQLKILISTKNLLKDLYKAQIDNNSNEVIADYQKRLNTLYDDYKNSYGYINDKDNDKIFKKDNSLLLLKSLESFDKDGNYLGKAKVFTERVIETNKEPKRADNIMDALSISLNYRGKIDLDYMSKLCNKSKEEIIENLEGKEIFYNPLEKKYESKNSYLTGDVKEKFRELENYKISKINFLSDQEKNIIDLNLKELKSVFPKDIEAQDINFRLGSNWIPVEFIEDFVKEILSQNSIISYSDVTGKWHVSNKNSGSYFYTTSNQYGTSRMNALHILEKTLNLNERLTIKDSITDIDGKEKIVVNKKETILVQQKQALLKQTFKDWLFEDSKRRNELVRLYNDRFNGNVERNYDGSNLNFPGINKNIELLEHQKNVVARSIFGGNSLIDHVVGAGKTFSAIASIIESKRLGLSNKAMIVVPNHLTEQWGNDIIKLYPNSNILVATKDDFTKENRKEFFGKIANNNYDAIVIGHSQFTRIPLSIEYERNFVKRELEELDKKVEKLSYSEKDSFSHKQIKQQQKKLEAKLEKIINRQKNNKDLDIVNFEELGIDKLVIDEAHEFKNLQITTSLTGVSGISTSSSQKAFDLYMKTKYINDITNNKGLMFLTGTPISNSMGEMYIMQKYLQEEILEEKGLINFDSWASVFGEITNSMELKPEGEGYQMKTKFSKFCNLPELITMFKEIADIKLKEDLDLPIPTLHNEIIETKPSDIQKDLVHELANRADRVRAGEDPKIDNMLKITGDGKKIALDVRILNPDLPDYENSKVNTCVNKVFEIYKDTEKDKLTQLIFCDISTPTGKNSKEFNVYDDIKTKLLDKGVKEKEIAFIHDAKNEKEKKAIFEKVQNGDIRVLLGSTQMMGTGTNVQDKLIALHNLDCPWRPADRDQRIGRVERQGNTNKDVYEYTYITSGTFDAYLYQMLENKQRFISQIMKSDNFIRSAEDMDETVLNYAEIKALSIDNPLIKDKMELENDVNRMAIERSAHLANKIKIEDIINDYPGIINKMDLRRENIKEDIETIKNNTNKDFVMYVDNIKYEKASEAGKAIVDGFKKHGESKEDYIKYRGMKIKIAFDPEDINYEAVIHGKEEYRVKLGKSELGNVTRIENRLNNLFEEIDNLDKKKNSMTNDLEIAKSQLDSPYPQEQEYQEKLQKLNEINIKLRLGEDLVPVEELIEQAKSIMIDKDLNTDLDFNDLSQIELYNRENSSNKLIVNVNLEDPKIETILNGELVAREKAQSLEDLIEFKLKPFDINEHIGILQAEGKLQKNSLLDLLEKEDKEKPKINELEI